MKLSFELYVEWKVCCHICLRKRARLWSHWGTSRSL